MSNIVNFNPAQVPAFARTGELSDTAKALAGGVGGQTGKRISIKGGVFRLVHGGKEVASIEDRHLDVVLIKAAPKVSRIYFSKPFDSDSPAAPDCWSADGDKPSEDSANKQATRCTECPQNVAGSGQGHSRACRYQQRIAAVLDSAIDGDILQLTLPATSIFGKADGDNRPLQEYARWLAAQAINPEMVVTRMKFDTKAENPKLFFKPTRWLTPEEYETVLEQAQTDDAVKAVTMTVSKMDGVAAPAKLAGKPPVKIKPAPVEVEAEDEEEEAAPPPPKAKKAVKKDAEVAEDTEEPTVRKDAPKAPQVSAKSDLSQMVSDWDDE